jgi:hypothetical protein
MEYHTQPVNSTKEDYFFLLRQIQHAPGILIKFGAVTPYAV